MKLQSLGIIFTMIILPMVIILSYYISLQVDTIALQTTYDSRLMNATYDALSALEINTANEDLSSVSDSLRSIIEASNSIFFNTLSTNFGVSNASNSYIKSYIPAILYTLYDGYYIYSPTKQPKICTYGDADSEAWALANLWTIGDSESATSVRFTLTYDQEGKKDTSKDGQPIYVVKDKVDGKYYVTETGDLLYKQTDGSYDTSLDNAEYSTDYILKSYMPYAAEYKHNDIDVTINYTLDNYLNIIGTIGGVYYTKTGYLIDPKLVTKVIVDDSDDRTTSLIGSFNNPTSYTVGYNEETAESYCLSGEHKISVTLKETNPDDSSQTIETTITAERINLHDAITSEEDRYLSVSEAQEKLTKLYEDYQSAYYSEVINGSGGSTINDINKKIQYLENRLQNIRAVAYYVSSTCFSRWVYVNLSDLEAKDIQMDVMSDDEQSNYSTTLNVGIYADFTNDTTQIFNYVQNPENKEISSFENHKAAVIRNSIQYNLNLAFSVYNNMSKGKLTFEMPMLTDEEWAKIVSRISVVSFMQGIPCGAKTYSNYSLVYSTNNEMTVIPDEIYYVKKDEFNDGKSETHRIDCSDLADDTNYIAFPSKELKYDKIYNKSTSVYEYDHKNLSCYNCIINKNNKKSVNSSGIEVKEDTINVFKLSSTNKVRAYYIAVGALRQNLYKTNALPNSEGNAVVYSKNHATGSSLSALSNSIASNGTEAVINAGNLKRGINQLKRIQIVLYGLSTNDIRETTVKFDVIINDKKIGSQTLSTTYYSDPNAGHPEYIKNQTIELDVDPNLFTGSGTALNIKLVREGGKSSTLYFDNVYVNAIYK